MDSIFNGIDTPLLFYVGAFTQYFPFKVRREFVVSHTRTYFLVNVINAEFDAGFGVCVHLHVGFGDVGEWHDGIDQALGG